METSFAAPDQADRNRESHDQPRICRSRPHRPVGGGRILHQPHRLHPGRDPGAAWRPCGRGRASESSAARSDLGLREVSRADLEAARDAGEVLHIRVVGLARLAPDITPELALATIGSINVLGALTGATRPPRRAGAPHHVTAFGRHRKADRWMTISPRRCADRWNRRARANPWKRRARSRPRCRGPAEHRRRMRPSPRRRRACALAPPASVCLR